MSIKTTKKDITNNFGKIICVPYCELQTLLRYRDIMAHTERSDGWGADIYDLRDLRNGTCIVTGYAPFGNVRPDYDLLEEFEGNAEVRRYTDADNREDFNGLIKVFLHKVLDERR